MDNNTTKTQELQLPETLMVKDVQTNISAEERQYLLKASEELLFEYYHDSTTEGLNAVFDEWKDNKGWLIELFKKSPDYVDGKFMIHKKATKLRRGVDSRAVCEFVDWARQSLRKIAEYNETRIGLHTLREYEMAKEGVARIVREMMPGSIYRGMTLVQWVNERERMCQRIEQARKEKDWQYFRNIPVSIETSRFLNDLDEAFSYLRVMVMENENPEVLNEKDVEWLNRRVTHTKVKPIVGQKTTKYFGKLMKEAGLHKIVDIREDVWTDNNTGELHRRVRDHGYNKWRAVLGDALNPIDYELDVVLSVNPIDYWTMSFGANWASCHTIDKTNDRGDANNYEGMHCSGTESYMLDPSSFVCYVLPPENWYEKNDEDINLDTELKSKFKRCIFSLGEDKLLQMRTYPDGRDGGDKGIAAQLRNIVQKEIADLLQADNMWQLQKGASACSKVTKTRGTHYPDYKSCDDCNVSYLRRVDGLLNDKLIVIGHNPICISCGDEHKRNDTLLCNSCLGYEVCEHCGAVIEDTYYARHIEGKWYCDEGCAEADGWRWSSYEDRWLNMNDEDIYYDPHAESWFTPDEETVCTASGMYYINAENALDEGYVPVVDDDVWHRPRSVVQTEDGRYYTTIEAAMDDGYVLTEDDTLIAA